MRTHAADGSDRHFKRVCERRGVHRAVRSAQNLGSVPSTGSRGPCLPPREFTKTLLTPRHRLLTPTVSNLWLFYALKGASNVLLRPCQYDDIATGPLAPKSREPKPKTVTPRRHVASNQLASNPSTDGTRPKAGRVWGVAADQTAHFRLHNRIIG